MTRTMWLLVIAGWLALVVWLLTSLDPGAQCSNTYPC